MSLPEGFLDELRTRLSLAQVVGRKVTWDARRSNQGKGDYWAPCPFHQEKTASFHVDDRKGFYYCFGCHAKGDAIAFVRETENAGFLEAVEILAREAGLPLPERDPAEHARADRRTRLATAVEEAVRHYRLQLRTAAAGPAREYLAGRGLDDAALERWEIGFAPDARRGLTDALTARGLEEDVVVDAGLAARPEGGGAAYDRFRGRIVFPIRDGRGRAVGLGGRAMDPAAHAKYLNSPQTDLFDKGRSLFNHAPAREAARRDGALIVAEGYMDVIALGEAGFGAAVAPLGTAITEAQLELLWRIHPEPVVALDGDASGLRAAMRLVDLALPRIAAGRSLRFALLPAGMDPDDVLRRDGPEAMRRLIDAAAPMVTLLWRRETEGRTFDSPERRATLDRALGAAIRQIGDARLRAHYTDEIKRLRWELFNPQTASAPGRRRPRIGRAEAARLAEAARFGQAPHTAARASALVQGGEAASEAMREAVILATLIRHPALLSRFEGEIERVEMTVPEHDAMRAALLDPGTDDAAGALERAVGRDALDRLQRAPHVRLSPGVGDDPERAAMCLAEELAKLSARRGARGELAEAMARADSADDNVLWRLGRAAEVLSGIARRNAAAAGEYDVAPNGAQVDRDDRAALASLIDSIDFRRRRGRRD